MLPADDDVAALDVVAVIEKRARAVFELDAYRLPPAVGDAHRARRPAGDQAAAVAVREGGADGIDRVADIGGDHAEQQHHARLIDRGAGHAAKRQRRAGGARAGAAPGRPGRTFGGRGAAARFAPFLVGEAALQLAGVRKVRRVVGGPALQRAQNARPVAEAAVIGAGAAGHPAQQRGRAFEPARLHDRGMQIGEQPRRRDLRRFDAGQQSGLGTERRPVVEPCIDARGVDAGRRTELADGKPRRATLRGNVARRSDEGFACVLGERFWRHGEGFLMWQECGCCRHGGACAQRRWRARAAGCRRSAKKRNDVIPAREMHSSGLRPFMASAEDGGLSGAGTLSFKSVPHRPGTKKAAEICGAFTFRSVKILY